MYQKVSRVIFVIAILALLMAACSPKSDRSHVLL